MRPALTLLPALALSALLAVVAVTANLRHRPGHVPPRFVMRPPVSFEPNVGQAAPGVRFLSRGRGYTLEITDSGAVLLLGSGNSPQRRRERRGNAEGTGSPIRRSQAPT